jgi:hypothetical protein
MKSIFFHMGYPKCLSTTLQKSIFTKHPEINYGGVVFGDTIHYKNESIELLFESILKYSNNHFYQSYLAEHKDILTKFIDNSDLPVVFSSEHMSMNFTLQGIDSLTKYQRIKEIFDNYSINILLINRNPISIIKSLYSEFLKMGYSETYDEFLNWIIRYSDRNFLLELNYIKKENQLRSIFGDINITWLDFEEVTKNDIEQNINKFVSEWLNISNLNLDCKIHNKSLSANQLESLLEINKKVKRELGLSQTEPFERHRNKLILQKFGESESFIFENVRQKRLAIDSIVETDGNFKLSNDELENKIINIIYG